MYQESKLKLKELKFHYSDYVKKISNIICQYIPYIVAIVVLKLCVITLMVATLGGDNRLKVVNFDDYSTAVEDRQPPTGRHVGPAPGRTVSPFGDVNHAVLDHLNDTVLLASAYNRTPADTLWLFFNRVPRTGGQTVVALLQSLSKDLDFQHQEHEYRTPWDRLLTADEQKNLGEWFEYNYWPKSYDRKALYINFTNVRSKYVKTTPAYVTMLRDPVEKFISHFRWKRANREKYDIRKQQDSDEEFNFNREWYWRNIGECVLEKDEECSFTKGQRPKELISSVAFLCGQKKECLEHGNKWALQMAKYNLEYEYSVVGILEKMNSTLDVLEHYVPMFFRGAKQRYWSGDFTKKRENFNPKHKEKVYEMVRKLLKIDFALEYELYEFAVQRLERQRAKIEELVQNATPLPKKASQKDVLSTYDRLQMDLDFNPGR